MPSLMPIIPLTAIASSLFRSVSQSTDIGCVLLPGFWLPLAYRFLTARDHPLRSSLRRVTKRLDLDIHPRRQIQLHERIHGIRRGLENVDQPLVGAHLELLARFLVHVR